MNIDLEQQVRAALHEDDIDWTQPDPGLLAGLRSRESRRRYRFAAVGSTCAVAVIAGGLFVASASGEHHVARIAQAGDATVRGRLMLAGHVTTDGYQAQGVAGLVRFSSPVNGVFTVETDSDGNYEVQVPAGSYRIEGNSPKFEVNDAPGLCQPRDRSDATPIAAGSAAIDIICPDY